MANSSFPWRGAPTPGSDQNPDETTDRDTLPDEGTWAQEAGSVGAQWGTAATYAHFYNRLSNYLSSAKQYQYDRMYGFLTQQTTRGRSQGEYVASKSATPGGSKFTTKLGVSSFTFRRLRFQLATSTSPAYIGIHGHATTEDNKEEPVTLEGHWERGNWYFTEIEYPRRRRP